MKKVKLKKEYFAKTLCFYDDPLAKIIFKFYISHYKYNLMGDLLVSLHPFINKNCEIVNTVITRYACVDDITKQIYEIQFREIKREGSEELILWPISYIKFKVDRKLKIFKNQIVNIINNETKI